MFLLDGHGILISAIADTRMTEIYKVLSIPDTVEWNSEIAYKQTIFHGTCLPLHSKSEKIATLEDIKIIK